MSEGPRSPAFSSRSRLRAPPEAAYTLAKKERRWRRLSGTLPVGYGLREAFGGAVAKIATEKKLQGRLRVILLCLFAMHENSNRSVADQANRMVVAMRLKYKH